jgi:hypothetical protein
VAKPKAKPKPKTKKPLGTPNPPPNTYDPILDSQLGASTRGLRDLIADIGPDTGTLRVRAQDDLGTGLAELKQAGTRAGEDRATGEKNIQTGYGRNLSDLLTARARGGEDYQTSVAGLQRDFANLGTQQAGQQRKAGVALGGAAEQAARKRAANEALQRAPIDTAYRRFTDDSASTEGRLGDDRTNAIDALNLAYKRGTEDLGAQGLKLGLASDRQSTDWGTQLQRARREQGAFAADTLKAKVAQFLQNFPGQKVPYDLPATVPPPAPKSITVGPNVPGITKKRGKNKRGQRTVTYTNTPLTGP